MPSRNNNHTTLTGQRGCLIWFFWFIVLGALAAGGYYFRNDAPSILEKVQAQLHLTTPAPTPVPAPDYTALIQDFRRGEQAAVRSALEPTINDILSAVAVYATGRALQQVQDEVAGLQTDSRWQDLNLEKFNIVQVLPDSPTAAKLLTDEVYRKRTYERQAGVDAEVAAEHYQVSGVYVVEYAGDHWAITDIATGGAPVSLPD